MSEHWKVLGLMSGSSLDGVDLAFCEFQKKVNAGWVYNIKQSETFAYDKEWKELLQFMPAQSAAKIAEYDILYGKYLGKISKAFLAKHDLKPDFISSHGHTIFHEPAKGFTLQLGDGQAMAIQSGFSVICDFRTKDILLGGQGAPLVPIGDKLLFADYEMCLNIGGIANISFDDQNKRIAYDICPANQVLNFLSLQKNIPFDKGGAIARSGEVNTQLLNLLNQDPFYRLKSPKSLSNQYVRRNFIEVMDSYQASIENKLRTFVEHIAMNICDETNDLPTGNMLVTGGGAHNSFLRERIEALSKHQIIIPVKKLVDFKEALVFAFIGILRKRNEINCLASVTGARTDCSTGIIF